MNPTDKALDCSDLTYEQVQKILKWSRNEKITLLEKIKDHFNFPGSPTTVNIRKHIDSEIKALKEGK